VYKLTQNDDAKPVRSTRIGHAIEPAVGGLNETGVDEIAIYRTGLRVEVVEHSQNPGGSEFESPL